MKQVLLASVLSVGLLLLTSEVNAQTRRSVPLRPRTTKRPAAPARPAVAYKDTLYRLDQTRLAVRMAEVTDSTVVYYEATAPTRPQTMAKRNVWKVIFADGSTSELTPLPAAAPAPPQPVVATAPTPDPVPEPTPSAPIAPSPNASAPDARYPGDKTFSRLHITIGPELTIYTGQGAWSNDSTGFGMKQNIGGSLRLDVQLVRWAAISATAGYAGWELVRNYTREGLQEYTETKRLTQIPLQLGVKIYPFGGFYLLPEGGVNLLFSSVKTSAGHPVSVDAAGSSTVVAYGGSVGIEIRANNLLLDLSARYQIQNVQNLSFQSLTGALTEQVSLAGVRLGIGFQSKKK